MRIVIISLIRREINKTRNRTMPDPIQADMICSQLLRTTELLNVKKRPKPRITRATPRLAPELIPSTSGPAKGFLNTVCICNPLTAKDDPATRAVIALGNLKSKRIDCQTPELVSFMKSIPIMLLMGIFTGPDNKSARKKNSIRMSSAIINTNDLSFLLSSGQFNGSSTGMLLQFPVIF